MGRWMRWASNKYDISALGAGWPRWLMKPVQFTFNSSVGFEPTEGSAAHSRSNAGLSAPGRVRMTSVPIKQAAIDDFPRPAVSALSAVPFEGLETRPWYDRMISTSHADISVRQTKGKKLPILLLHGGGLCKEVFDRQLESSLGAPYRMIAIDLPGHGASSDAFDPDRTYRIEGLADLALEVVERLDIDDAVVVGASLGGWVGMQMIQTFPGLVGLALTGTPLGDPALPSKAPELPEFELLSENAPTDDQIDAFLRLSLGDVAGAPFARAVKRTDAPQSPNKSPGAAPHDRFCGPQWLRRSQLQVVDHLLAFVVAQGESRRHGVQPGRVAPLLRAHGASPPFQRNGARHDCAAREPAV